MRGGFKQQTQRSLRHSLPSLSESLQTRCPWPLCSESGLKEEESTDWQETQ